MGKACRFSLIVAVLLLFVGTVIAQVLPGTITGLVTDPSDAVVPGAKVTIVDLSTGRERTATTNTVGAFSVTSLNFGFYRVAIEAQGFAKFVVPRVQVNTGQVSQVFAKLELAKMGSEVVVTSEQSVVETESAEIKRSLDRRMLLELPIPGRNPLELARTLPGVAAPTSSGIGDLFVHGLRGNSTNITQDGINVADNTVKTSAFFSISGVTVEQVGEFSISTSGIGVDAGFGAAQVTLRTARGSNALHGSAFWYQRTSAFNANTWFNNASGTPRPFQLQNRLGFNLSGPVYAPKVYNGKNKTWFFGAFEAFREPLSRSRTRTVMSDAARTGSFTYTPTCTAATCPAGVTAGQPRTVNLLTPGLGTIGNTGRTPAIDPDVMNFYNSLVPSPNTDAGCANGDKVNIRCFIFNLPGKSKQNRYTLRLDHQLTKNHAIEFAYNQANFLSAPDLLNGIEPNFPKSPGGDQESKRQVFSWALHSTFGTTTTNEARFGIQRAPVVFVIADNSFSATGGFQLVTPGVLTDPQITSTNLPQGRNTPVLQAIDNFAWVKGRHTFRVGGEWKQVNSGNFFWNVVVPRVTLGTNSANPDGLTTAKFTSQGGISQADLTRAQTIFDAITGMLSNIQQGFNHTSKTSGFVPRVPRNIDPIQNNWSGYFQDSFKLWPNFNLTYGVRYEYQGVFDLRNGLILQPVDGLSGLWGPSGLNNLFSPSTTPVLNDVLLNFTGGRNGRPVYQRDVNNFAPFLGFAWDPFKSGKTSIRAGMATHYTQDGFTVFSTAASTGNAGLFTVATAPTPTGTFANAGNPAPSLPADVFPVSQKANFIASNAQSLWLFRPDLKTPYVWEWNLSVSRELGKRITVEARYVGNHAVKLFRTYSINELNLLNSPFTFGGASVSNILTEFQNAQFNLALSGNTTFSPATAGARPLPILSALFGIGSPACPSQITSTTPPCQVPASSGFTNSTFITNLQNNEVGRMFDTLRRSVTTYKANREANFPSLNFFVANPWANGANLVDNTSWSNYHGLELELRRRFSSGLFLQAGYTYSKVLTDVTFLTSQQEQQDFRFLSDRGRDKFRAAFDVTHSLSVGAIYPLPFGKGQRFAGNANIFLDKLINGWSIQSWTRWYTGSPFTIQTGSTSTGVTSNRQTTGSLQTTVASLRNMTASQLQKFVGVFETPQGVFWLDPKSGLINLTTGKATICTPGQTTPCFETPAPGQDGNLPFNGFNAPFFTNQDFSIIKRTAVSKISENFNFEIRFEFFNAFNHPNFGGLTTRIESSTFGQLTSIVDTARGGGVNSRIIQWALRVNW
jgi:hypothetical protein